MIGIQLRQLFNANPQNIFNRFKNYLQNVYDLWFTYMITGLMNSTELHGSIKDLWN